MSITISNKKGQIIGELRDNVYYTVRSPEHFMRKFQGFGISIDVLDNLIKYGCTHICIIYKGTKSEQKLIGEVSMFLNSDKEFIFEKDDLQRFVSIKEFEEYMQR